MLNSEIVCPCRRMRIKEFKALLSLNMWVLSLMTTSAGKNMLKLLFLRLVGGLDCLVVCAVISLHIVLMPVIFQ